jgi:hypothetical protein
MDCSQGNDSTCQAKDPNSFCVAFDRVGTIAWCLEGCVGGPIVVGETKCHSRKNVACDASSGFCTPTCRGDFECGTRKCDPRSGLCVDASSIPANLGGLGAKCDPTSTTRTCQGHCIKLGDTEGMCSSFCTFGQLGCGVDPTSTAPDNGYCFLSPDPNFDNGDLAFCAQLCDCDGDCLDPDLICNPVASNFGLPRAGVCNPKIDSATGAPNSNIQCKPTSRTDGGAGDAGTGGAPGSGGATGSGGSARDSGSDAH